MYINGLISMSIDLKLIIFNFNIVKIVDFMLLS